MKRSLLLSLLLLTGCTQTEDTAPEQVPESAPEEATQTPAEEQAPEKEETPQEEQAPQNEQKQEEPAAEQEPVEVLAENLEIPWSINKDGTTFYISERAGSVARIDEDGTVTRQEVEFSDPLSDAAEAGFLGFVLKPDFADSREAYAYYVYEQGSSSYNRVATLTLEDDVWRETASHLDGIMTGIVHHGGRLAFSPDGTLFLSIGDAYSPDFAQGDDTQNGKIMYMNDEGMFGIYSSGHRNPQGFAWHEGKMYASEHGESANDEINIIEEGRNYGWPLIQGNEEAEGYETPFFTTGSSETWAPSGIAAHDGRLYVASLRGTAVNVIDLETGEAVDSIDGYGRVRDVLIEDGQLYLITNNTDGRGNPEPADDRLVRISLDQ